ncbi:MAG: MFS transporter [Marmoricola sp.]
MSRPRIPPLVSGAAVPVRAVVARVRGTGLPADVFAMSAVALSVALGFGVVSPAIPLFASEFGVDATAAGAVVSAFALMRLVADPVAGRLVDRIGQRAGLMLGLAVVAASSVVAGLAQSYPQLLVLRGVGGVGSAVFGVSAVSLVLKVATHGNRGQAMSVYRSGFLVGGVVGPAVGGAVLGISLRAPFFLYGGTLVLAGVVAMVFVGRRERLAARSGGDIEPDEPSTGHDEAEPVLRELLRTREYQAALMANLAVGLAVFGVRSAVVPLFFVHDLGTSDATVAYAFLVSSLVQVALLFPAGRWTDSAGRRPALLAGSLGAALGLALLAVGGSVAVALVALAVFGAGSAFLGSAPAALVGDVAGRRSGSAVAVFNMASDLGAVVGPTLAGWLVDHGSYVLAFGLAAAVVALAGLLGLRLPRASSASQPTS